VTVVASRRVATALGLRPAAVHVDAAGKIAQVVPGPPPAGAIDHGELVIMPGIVDTHVHINEPGRTDWEGFTTATCAAARGGVTTLVDMPLNSIPPTTSAAHLVTKRDAARGQCRVDVGFWGGVVPGNAAALAALIAAGARGAKCFLVESGVDEFPCVTEADLLPAMRELGRLGVPLLVHAELAGPIDAALSSLVDADPAAYSTYLRSRPEAAESEAIAMMVRLAEATGAAVHIVHHSAASALDLLRAAQARGLRLSAETCPHYLTFAAEDIPDGHTEYKCAPPIRARENREQLWDALADGTLGLVASDHSPCTPALKAGSFVDAWGGVSGLQLALPAVWTQARARGRSVSDLVRWMCAGPAQLAGLAGRKGVLATGADADLVVWDPEATFTVDAPGLAHKHKLTPYAGRRLHGVVAATYLRGQTIFDAGRDGRSGDPQGRFL
jgi:allantoinase